MSTLVIYETNHRDRAEALARMYATRAQDMHVKPSTAAGLTTLVFWGHGDAKKFCELDSDAFVALAGRWKKLNPTLQTIEMITCNARHKNAAFADAYTEQVVKKLTTRLQGVKFRALPMVTTKEGVTCEWSVLKWHAASATWAYVAAPSYAGGSVAQRDKHMSDGVRLLEDFMFPRGTCEGYLQALVKVEAFQGLKVGDEFAMRRKWTQADVDAYNDSVKSIRKNAFVMAGTLAGLRWWISDVT